MGGFQDLLVCELNSFLNLDKSRSFCNMLVVGSPYVLLHESCIIGSAVWGCVIPNIVKLV